MYYTVLPTNKDIVHGKVWKSHKYISRIFKNGHWVYTYTKNRLRGNKVTNADGKNYTPGYTTNINRKKMEPLNSASRKHDQKYTYSSGSKITNQNVRLANSYFNGFGTQSSQYSPTIKTYKNKKDSPTGESGRYEPITEKQSNGMHYTTQYWNTNEKKNNKYQRYGKMRNRK